MMRIAIIGLGWWGKQIVTCLADCPRFKVVAGCDIDHNARQYPHPRRGHPFGRGGRQARHVVSFRGAC